MNKTLSLVTILAAAIAFPAIAQTVTSPVPTAPSATAAPATNVILTTEQAQAWIGKPVYSSDDKKIGEVVAFERAAGDKVTEMHAGIGGFLGFGETNVRVTAAQFKLQGDRAVLNLTAAQAKDLPKVVK